MPFTGTEIFCLRDRPAYREAAGRWFHEKWGVPLAEYRRSIDACLAGAWPGRCWTPPATTWPAGALRRCT